MLLSFACLAAISWCGLLLVAWRARVRREMRVFLLSEGVPCCIACGREIRVLDRARRTEGACPHCGGALDPRAIELIDDGALRAA